MSIKSLHDNLGASSAVLWPNINYNGTGLPVSNGLAGYLAVDTGIWSYKSAGINGMQLFAFSETDTTSPAYSYTGHTETLLISDEPNFPALFAAATCPLKFIGINPAQVAVLMVDVAAGDTAVAIAPSQSFPMTGASMATFAAPGKTGALGFVATTAGGSTAVNVQYGDYSAGNGTVAWSGSGSLTVSWNGAAPVVSGLSGLPAGWSFSAPQKEADGTWRVTLNTGAAADTGLLYTGTGYTGSSNPLSPHVLKQLNSGFGWTYNSLKLFDMSALIYSSFAPTNTGYSFTGYQQLLLTASTPNFAATFTGTSPVSLLSLDNTDVVVSLVVNTTSASDSALMLTQSYPQAFYNFVSTSHSGLLAVLPASGIAQTISVSYGSLDGSGHFSAAGNGTLSVALSGGVPVITADGSLPDNWNFTAPEQQPDGSWRVSLSDQQVVSALSLYPQVNYGGTSVALAEHQSTTLRTLSNLWQYDSVRVGSLRWLSMTPFNAQSTTYDFRQYRDSYSAVDVPDISQDYPLASPLIGGIALGENDVVVRVRLVPQDSSQAMVLNAAQSWPVSFTTASLSNSVNQNGVLVVFDKTQIPRTINIQTGLLNADGTAAWQLSTTVMASWNNNLQMPVLVLGADAPADLKFSSMQATGKAGEFTTTLSVPNATHKIKVMGARSHRLGFYENTNNVLTAIDTTTLKPVEAWWRYQDESTSVPTTWFTDTRPGIKLLVSGSPSQMPVTLNESNIIGNGVNGEGAFAARNDYGAVSSWGDASYGGTSPDSTVNHDVIQLVASSLGMVALNRYGQIFGWGTPEEVDTDFVPPEIAALNDIVSITAGNRAFAAIRLGGQVVSWGYNIEMPIDVSRLTDVVQVSGGKEFFTARRASGQVVTWGNITQPTSVSNLTNVIAVAASPSAAVALRANGSVVAWGDALYGGSVPSDIAWLTDIKHVVAGGYGFAALRANGSVVAWGNGSYGGVIPSSIASLTNIVSIAASGGAFAALCSDGQVVAWGDPYWGGQLSGSLNNIVAITGADRAFAALDSLGQVHAWGDSQYGGIAPGSLYNVRAVYAGSWGFCALTGSKTVTCWGGGGGASANPPTPAIQGSISYENSYAVS